MPNIDRAKLSGLHERIAGGDYVLSEQCIVQVLAMATEALNGWEANTVVSRLGALQASNRAAADAQECNKITRRMSPVAPVTGLSQDLSSNQSYDPSSFAPVLPSTPPRSEQKSTTTFSSPASDIPIGYE